jgi:hypothetical protein
MTEYLNDLMRRLRRNEHYTTMDLESAKTESKHVAKLIASIEAQFENPDSIPKPRLPDPNSLADGFAWVSVDLTSPLALQMTDLHHSLRIDPN